MKIHGTIIRIGGLPDKQDQVFTSVDGVEVELLNNFLINDNFGNRLIDLIPGTRVTKVQKYPDRIDVEVDITDNLLIEEMTSRIPLFFAVGGSVHLKNFSDTGVGQIEYIHKARINQLALTLRGVDPAYLVRVGELA